MCIAKDYPVEYPAGRHAPPGVGSALLRPAAWLYGSASDGVRRKRLARRASSPGDVTVVSVGNLEVGGNGKTPFAMYLLEGLLERGARPVYLSRGYGGAAERIGAVTIVPAADTVHEARSPTRWIERTAPGLAADVGDEGAMVAMRCPRVPLVFSRHKPRALAVAIEQFSPSHIIMDDAFQSWGIARDVDIVMLDAEHPFGNGRRLPAGTLREAPSALSRAGIIVLNGAGNASTDDDALLRCWVGGDVPLMRATRTLEFVDSAGVSAQAPRRPVVVSAVARPQRFEAAVTSATIERALRFPDHHRYTPSDAARIRNAVADNQAHEWVTTEKDWVKLRSFEWPQAPLIARLVLEVSGGDIFDHIEKPQANPPAAHP